MFFKKWGLLFAWLIALIGLLGSLFFSEIIKLDPCKLCWYQRICLFPLAIILLIAFLKNDNKIAIYVYPLVIIGAIIALYQLFFPFCKEGVCQVNTLMFFGMPINLSLMSFLAFIFIYLLLLLSNLVCEK